MSLKTTAFSVCPHDCPSTCALDVEVIDNSRIGRIKGAKDNSYTLGVVCAKVARYSERIHHPNRLLNPMIRSGPKGSGNWQHASWQAALDLIADRFLHACSQFGSETVWPYYFAGTMGLVQRDSINRLRHVGRYSDQFSTVCTNTASTGYFAGTGRITGVDPREMAFSDCIIIWGTNVASTQVNVMSHAVRARKNRGAKIIAIDIYETPTLRQADFGFIIRPGTDGALACAIMHILFRDGHADWQYLSKYTDDPVGLEQHLQNKTPEWAANITGLTVHQVETLAEIIGRTKRCFFRIGYGFTRQRNGAAAMHAVSSIAAVTGAWQYQGGGIFFSNSGIFELDKNEIEGLTFKDTNVRALDQSKIGRVLTGDPDALYQGPPVTALFIQNTNPANIAPEQRLVIKGLCREDLFTVVHEQFMTDTARYADVVLPATMFLEHDDIYRGGGQQHLLFGGKVIDPPKGPKSNLYVINELARRLGFGCYPEFNKTALELIDSMLQRSGRGSLAELKEQRWLDLQPPFETGHFLNGFGWPDKRYRFKAVWTGYQAPDTPPKTMGYQGPWQQMPSYPDQWDVIEKTDFDHPFRLATPPAHNFLNSSFSETATSIKKEVKPQLYIHPEDALALNLSEGELIEMGNHRGSLHIHIKKFSGLQRGVVISPGLFPNSAFAKGEGINTLTGGDAPAPNGGLPVHDIKVWLKKLG